MAFLPTVALFLAVAVAEETVEDVVAAEEQVAEEEEPMDAEEDMEEDAVEEDDAGAFAECAKNTTWAEEDAAQGYTLDANTTCQKVHPQDCLKHADIANCCPEECNKEFICGGFESKKGAELATCLNDMRWRGGGEWFAGLNPSYWGVSDWGNNVECETLLADPKATTDYSEINLCCNASASAARRLAEDAEAGDAEAEDADADAEDADADEEAEADAGGMYPASTGDELVSKMCNGESPAPATPTTGADKPETTEPSTDGTDPAATGSSSASTFGFTALALMLVTA